MEAFGARRIQDRRCAGIVSIKGTLKKGGSNMFKSLLLNMIPLMIAQVTPEIKSTMKDFIIQLKSKTRQTPNPYDDMLVDLLEELIDC